MALVSKELVEKGTYDESPDTYTLTRVWWVEGEELKTLYPHHFGVSYAVRSAPNIPNWGSTYTPDVSSPTLRVSSRTAKRISHTVVEVTVKYEYSKSTGGGSDDGTLPEDEADRRFLYNVPYNERLEFGSTEEKVIMGWDPDDVTKPVLINPFGGGAPVYSPKVVWAFTILIRPTGVHWENIGHYNTDNFPPFAPTNPRPFRFAATSLLYLGASGGIATKGDGNIFTTTGVVVPWAWELTFKFAFNPVGWDAVDFYYYKTVASEAAESFDVGAWWNPYTKTEETGSLTPPKLEVAFGKEFYNHPDDIGLPVAERRRLLRPFSGAVMSGLDFHDSFGFDWEYA